MPEKSDSTALNLPTTCARFYDKGCISKTRKVFKNAWIHLQNVIARPLIWDQFELWNRNIHSFFFLKTKILSYKWFPMYLKLTLTTTPKLRNLFVNKVTRTLYCGSSIAIGCIWLFMYLFVYFNHHNKFKNK